MKHKWVVITAVILVTLFYWLPKIANEIELYWFR